jgi:hypothetical protein
VSDRWRDNRYLPTHLLFETSSNDPLSLSFIKSSPKTLNMSSSPIDLVAVMYPKKGKADEVFPAHHFSSSSILVLIVIRSSPS